MPAAVEPSMEAPVVEAPVVEAAAVKAAAVKAAMSESVKTIPEEERATDEEGHPIAPRVRPIGVRIRIGVRIGINRLWRLESLRRHAG
jgi:hypothetical protein